MLISNGDDYQIVISDTPGILDPNYQLQEAMMKFINETLIDSDVLVFIDEITIYYLRNLILHNRYFTILIDLAAKGLLIFTQRMHNYET